MWVEGFETGRSVCLRLQLIMALLDIGYGVSSWSRLLIKAFTLPSTLWSLLAVEVSREHARVACCMGCLHRATVEARKLEHDYPLIKKQRERRRTSINRPRPIFQSF